MCYFETSVSLPKSAFKRENAIHVGTKITNGQEPVIPSIVLQKSLQLLHTLFRIRRHVVFMTSIQGRVL